MLHYFEPSNIVNQTSGIIIHGCNAQGVMGSGVAKQLRAKYPDIFYSYVEHINALKEQDVNPLGTVNFVNVTSSLVIANAITQEFYGRDGEKYVSYIALKTCLDTVSKWYKNIPIHIPYLIGAGLGGGDEETILRIIETKLKYCDVYLHKWK